MSIAYWSYHLIMTKYKKEKKKVQAEGCFVLLWGTDLITVITQIIIRQRDRYRVPNRENNNEEEKKKPLECVWATENKHIWRVKHFF